MSNLKRLRRLGLQAPDRRPRGTCFGCLGVFLHQELTQIDILPTRFRKHPQFPGRMRRRLCTWCQRHLACRLLGFESFEQWNGFWRPLNYGYGLFRSRPEKPKPKGRIAFPLSLRCHFCGEPIGFLDPLGRVFDIHHQIERHTFESKVEADQLSNLSYAHRAECHVQHHQQKDRALAAA